MFSVFLELVKRVGVFVIIGQTILHFGISKKYEKYMKLVISFMVAAQILFAFGVYLKSDDDSRQMMSWDEYMETWDLTMKEVEERMEKKKEEMEGKIEEEMKKSTADVTEGENITEAEQTIMIEKIAIP